MNAATATPEREPVTPPDDVAMAAIATGASEATTGPIETSAPDEASTEAPAETATEAPIASPTMFAGFLGQAAVKRRTSWLRRATVAVSLSAHGLLLAIGVAYSFWAVDELSPPRVV